MLWVSDLLVKQYAHQQGKGVIGEKGVGFGITEEEY